MNRMQAVNKTAHQTRVVIFWAMIVSLSLLLSHNAILYFTHGGEYGIIPEKSEARKDWIWTMSFYIHLPAGIICLAIPWLSFVRNIHPLFRNLHRIAGQIYSFITLIFVGPTGIYLALYAKGGGVTQVGFVLQGLLLSWYTYQGYALIRKGDSANHVNAMIRSYAVATVVLTFRVLHLIFFMLNLPYQDNYAASQWLGLTFNLLIAELIIIGRSKSIHQVKHKFYEAS